MKYHFILLALLVIGCTGVSPGDYRVGTVAGMIPYAVSNYDLKGDVVAMDQTFLNNSYDTDVLNKYDTEKHTFKDGFLEKHTREGLNGGKYRVNETSASFKEGLPIMYTTTRSGGSTTVANYEYDADRRMIVEKSGSFTTVFDYDGSRLVSKEVFKGESKTYRQKYTYEYDGNGNIEKSSLTLKDEATGDSKLSSYKLYNNGAIVQDFMMKDGQEELYAAHKLDNHGNYTSKTDKYDHTETVEYIYDDRGNWNLAMNHTDEESVYVRQRVITYKDGTITGEKYNDAEVIAALLDLDFDVDSYAEYLMTINYMRDKQ